LSITRRKRFKRIQIGIREGFRTSDRPSIVSEARASIRGTLRDPVTKLLLTNSQLTSPQLETILADSLSSEKGGFKAQRRLLRPFGKRITRGAFNRTLIQAQTNVIRSIYTILLLGYVGLFDTASLQPFMELSDTIQTYIKEARQTAEADREAVEQLNQRLLDSVTALAKRQSFKDTLDQ
jgi:hypothetical protein